MTECPRCGIVTPDDDQAAEHGGISTAQDTEDGLCLVCMDYLQEASEDAQARLDNPEWDPDQSSLADDW